MQYTLLSQSKNIAYLHTVEQISDVTSALDLILSAQYETNCNKLILDKRCFDEKFFSLRSGLAGDILQKFVNYHVKVAIVGNYSHYTSKPFKDFVYESNKGKDIFFVSTLEEAIRKLEHVK